MGWLRVDSFKWGTEQKRTLLQVKAEVQAALPFVQEADKAFIWCIRKPQKEIAARTLGF